jgi:hypothetical protein
MRKFVDLAGIRFVDREPDAAIPEPKPERIANRTFFLEHDAPAVRRYRLDVGALRAAASHIVPAAGESPADGFPRQCAEALAEKLQRPLAAFPGGHNGFVLYPQAFAAQLEKVLAEGIGGTESAERTAPESTSGQSATDGRVAP